VLKQRFGVSVTTVQAAHDELVRGGFVVTRGILGTFVVEHPPHLHHYALVLFQQLGHCVRFLTTLAIEAAAIGSGPAPRITVFHGVSPDPENEPHQALLAAARSQRLAGMILVVEPWSLRDSPLLAMPNLPRVVIAPRPLPDWDTVALDEDSFLTKALDHFRARGRKRLAVIAGHEQYRLGDELVAPAAKRGLAMRPYWVQRLAATHPEHARECAHLMFNANQDERPDALMIRDDNLVEHTILGLLDAGIRVPQDLEIVAHCNFPPPTPSVVPLTRLGFDTRRILTTAMSTLDRLRRGKVGRSTLIPAEFESDVEARTRAATRG
jgi:DNA-binding LacI/PurR family transcriptional regulator